MQRSVFLVPYECPSCQLKKANPVLDVCSFVVPPRKIDGQPVTVGYYQDLEEKKVFVRCLKLTSEGHCTEWPPMVTIQLNGQVTSKGTNRVEVTDITANMPSPGKELTLEFLADPPCSEYLWCVALVRRRSEAQVYNIITILPETREHSVEMLFAAGKNPTRVDILPSRGVMLPHPVRGMWCSHFKCFDLKTYVEERVAKRTPDWKCPECGKPCYIFKFDRLQNQFQTQFCYASAIHVSRGQVPIPALPRPEPPPQKRKKLSSEPPRLFTFDDFVSGTVSDEDMWGSGCGPLWEEIRTTESCVCGQAEVTLEDGEFSVTKVDILIELD